MAKRLFVGRLPYEATNTQLEELFSQAGKVESVNVITDRLTGQGKGFAFVEMATEAEAQDAIKKLNGHNFSGRSIVVNEARPQEDRNKNSGYSSNKGGFTRNKRW